MAVTNIAREVDIAKDKAKYDAEAKGILGDKYIMAWIMSRVTDEFRGMPIEEIVQCIEGEPMISKVGVDPGTTNDKIIGRDTVDKVSGEGTVKYDILLHAIAPRGGRVKVIINVEAQKDFYAGYDYETRGIYYGARMISAQKEREFTDDNYNDIKKVYSIWICMNAPKYLQNTVTEYKIHQNKIYGNYTKPVKYDLLSVVIICLGKPEDNDYQNDEYQKLIRLLSVLVDEEMKEPQKLHILEEEYHIAITKNLKRSVNSMCNWSEGVIDRVTEKVTEKVTEQVTKEVTEQVTKEVNNKVLIQNIQKIMESLNVSVERACEILQVSVEEYEKAKQTLK